MATLTSIHTSGNAAMLRHIFKLIAFVAATLVGLPSRAGELTVTLHDVRAQGGHLNIALVASAEAWDGKATPVQAQQAPPRGERAVFHFRDLAPGRYAVMVRHDENDNGKLDTNLVGMPVEGYGFSNNPRVLRKPTWDEAAFDLGAADAAIDVTLR